MPLPRLDHDPRTGRDPKAAPIGWISLLGCWCAFDADTITEILKSSDFVAPNFAELHRNLERQVGDCSAPIKVLNHVASANEGERHAEIRRDVARVLTANVASTKEITAKRVHELVPQLCRANARVDLAQEIILPVWQTLFECLLGVSPPSQAGDGVSASQIFDLYLSLNRRSKINAKAGAMVETFLAAQDKLKTAPYYAAALSALGHDSIVSSLGCSLLHVLREEAGCRLSAMRFPPSLPATGVPYVERFAAKDRTIAGAAIVKGDRVRLYLDSGASNGDATNRPYFGRGRHSCLGEELSIWLWRTFTDAFAQLPLTCVVERAIRREPDWVFVYYSSIVVQFHA